MFPGEPATSCSEETRVPVYTATVPLHWLLRAWIESLAGPPAP